MFWHRANGHDDGAGESPQPFVGQSFGLQPGQVLLYTEGGLVVGPAVHSSLEATRQPDGSYHAAATHRTPERTVEVLLVGYGRPCDKRAVKLLARLMCLAGRETFA